MRSDASDVVYGVQLKRKGGLFERITGRIFYQAFRLLTGVAQPDNIVTARLMTRRYVQALVSHQERELNIGGLWVITGFKQSQQYVGKHGTSPTTYTLRKKIGHLVNAVTSFSSLPLVLTFYAGLLISLSATAFIAYLGWLYFFVSIPPSGYTSIIASIWFFSGLLFSFWAARNLHSQDIF